MELAVYKQTSLPTFRDWQLFFFNSYLDVYKWVHNLAHYHWESKNIVEPLFPIKT